MRSGSLTWAPPLYFLYYAAAAALVPFLTIYYQELGLTGSQIGFLAGLPALINLVSSPVWGAVSDVTRRHKLSLMIAMGGAILMGLSISAFKTFFWLIPIVILYAFFSSPVMPLVDSTTMNLLGANKARYGRIRVWGAIGWGVIGPIAGWLIESSGVMWSFWSYAGLLGAGLVVALGIPVSGKIAAPAGNALRKFTGSPRWLAFLGVAFCGAMALGVIFNFYFIYLRDLGASKFVLGISLSVATLSELPVMFFSNRLLRRWKPQRLIIAAMLFAAVRTLAYSFAGVPWLALLIQLLHGPTFSLLWVSGVSYADQIAPDGLEATAQGLFAGVVMGIGSAAGAFMGGVLYEQVGLVFMFRAASLIALVGVGLMLLMEKKAHESRI